MTWTFRGEIEIDDPQTDEPPLRFVEWVDENGEHSRMSVEGWEELGRPTEHPHAEEASEA